MRQISHNHLVHHKKKVGAPPLRIMRQDGDFDFSFFLRIFPTLLSLPQRRNQTRLRTIQVHDYGPRRLFQHKLIILQRLVHIHL